MKIYNILIIMFWHHFMVKTTSCYRCRKFCGFHGFRVLQKVWSCGFLMNRRNTMLKTIHDHDNETIEIIRQRIIWGILQQNKSTFWIDFVFCFTTKWNSPSSVFCFLTHFCFLGVDCKWRLVRMGGEGLIHVTQLLS